MKVKIIVSIIIGVASACLATAQTIQINIDHLFNARPVTTLTNGKLQSWANGIDGGGTADGYLTAAAASANGDKDAHALPNDPLIPADAHHPAILLHYKNGDTGKQTLNVAGADSFMFAVPHKKYRGVYLSLTSSEGPSQLHIRLTYADSSEMEDFTLPDYYDDIPYSNPDFSYALHDLAKWGPNNNITESNHHNIDVLNIHPNEKRILKSISVSKDKGGYLVFWAATGLAK